MVSPFLSFSISFKTAFVTFRTDVGKRHVDYRLWYASVLCYYIALKHLNLSKARWEVLWGHSKGARKTMAKVWHLEGVLKGKHNTHKKVPVYSVAWKDSLSKSPMQAEQKEKATVLNGYTFMMFFQSCRRQPESQIICINIFNYKLGKKNHDEIREPFSWVKNFSFFLHAQEKLCPKLCQDCVQLFVTPWTVACQAPLSKNLPGKNTEMDCHFLLQRIFPTQGSNLSLLCLLHWQVDSLSLYHLGNLYYT